MNKNGQLRKRVAWNKGLKTPKEVIQKLRKSHIGQIPWNKGTKGIIKPNKGSFKKGQIPWNKGLTGKTDKRVKKQGWMKGKHHTEETKRKISESKIGEYAGELSSNWKGGISCEPYCQDWTKEYKEYIKERDGNKCLNPVCRNNYNHLTLEIHHIDYNKKNCVPQNLLTLCKSCNARANFKREYWQQFYEKIIKSKYNIGADT